MTKTTIFLCVLSSIASTGVLAQSSGSLALTVHADDTRDNPYTRPALGLDGSPKPSGARQDVGIGSRPFPFALVNFILRSVSGTAQVNCGRTDKDGNVTFNWNTSFTVNSAEVRVIPTILQNNPTGCGLLVTDFSVVTGNTGDVVNNTPRGVFVHIRGYDTTIVGARADTIEMFPSEAANTYLSMLETVEMWDTMGSPYSNPSLGIRASMQSTNLFINQSVPFSNASVAPRAKAVLLVPHRATNEPFTVSHEMGHALMWTSLGLPLANIDPLVDYYCDLQSSWGAFNFECEKPAFAEAFAEVNGALWMWFRNADPLRNLGGGRTSRNPVVATRVFDLERKNRCGGSTAYNRMACNTRALWDLVDSAPTDADGSTAADLSDLVGGFRDFNDLCGPGPPIDNRCAWEGWPWPTPVLHFVDSNAVNWNDFTAWVQNSPNLTQTQILNIEAGNKMTGSTSD